MGASWVRTRKPLFIVAAALGVCVSLIRTRPLPYDLNALAASLALASGAHVEPRELRWEPSRGVLVDALLGRNLLFLGVPEGEQARDLFRASVRVTPEGRPLGVTMLRNLTCTRLGDDHSLVVQGDKAAIVTSAADQEPSVTWFDLAGEGAQGAAENLSDRAMAAVTNMQQTGSMHGMGRVALTFDAPVHTIRLHLAEEGLAVAATTQTGPIAAKFQHDTREIVGGNIHAEPARHLPKPLVFWAVDTVRAVPWIGPGPVAWLEERAFSWRDRYRRATSERSEVALATEAEAPPLAIASESDQDPQSWPPAPMRSIWKTPEPHEGEWLPPEVAFMKRLAPVPGASPGREAPPAFFRAFVRPDLERTYAKVLLVAMDMRQLELEMEAGVEDPKPLTGPPGTGRIPRDPMIYRRVAAAFNGGFKTEHGNYGMMLRRRILLPPVAGAASLIIQKDGRVGMGSWGATTKVSGLLGIADADIISMRQNLDPLVEGDVVNPGGRSLWGFTLPGSTMQTERSGVCVTKAGSLVYAWGDDVSGTTLGKAMNMAGCIYGMHLDMNPHHTGFIFTNITDLKGKNYKSELLSKQMEIAPDRYIEYAPKDFFYVLLKEFSPPDRGEGSVDWQVDAGLQPAPAWSPSLYHAVDGEVELTLIETHRGSFRLRGGSEERIAFPNELTDVDKKRVLLAVTLGAANDKRARALHIDGVTSHARGHEEGLGVLAIDAEGLLTLSAETTGLTGAAMTATESTELPLVLLERESTSRGRGMVHAALGVRDDGRMVIAIARTAAPGSVATALKKAKCVLAVALERSPGAIPAQYRSGTERAPRLRYAHTSLSVLSTPMLPPAFVFSPANPVVPSKKRK
jgi:hypothetical protein